VQEPEAIPERLNAVSGAIVDAAVTVHRTLGPGLLESVYEACLCHELRKRGRTVHRQVSIPIFYDGVELESNLCIDLLVQDEVVVELKAVDSLKPIHKAQLLTYLKLSGRRLGLLLNFNVPIMKNGIERVIL